MNERFKLRVAVYLLLLKEEKVLLQRRYNTPWANGWYSVPAGHFDGEETLAQAMIREAKEEIGVEIHEKELTLRAVLHETSDTEYITFFYTTNIWKGEPTILEPDRSDDLSWFLLGNLPDKTLANVTYVLTHMNDGILFSEFDWKNYEKSLTEKKESEVKNNE
jgi:8-oxo-dGTP pyrophosphatase MutT (NUDIX family)